MKTKILFEKQINKIKNNPVREYFLIFFNFKKVITKLVWFLMLATVVFSSSLLARQYYLDNSIDSVILNEGVAFSFGSEWGHQAIIAIQLVPSLLALIGGIFVNSIYFYIPCFLMAFGGFSNLIDRFIPDGEINGIDGLYDVVDYIRVTGSVFNLPDIFVVSSSVAIGLFLLIYIIRLITSEVKNKVNKENEKK